MTNNIPYRNIYAIILVSILILSIAGCNGDVNLKPVLTATELEIDHVVKESYYVWYVAKGQKPDFSKYDDYFTKNAIFNHMEQGVVTSSALTQQVEKFKSAFEKGHLVSFDEREIGAQTRVFGNVAHRISYHVYRTNTNDMITKRGVNSIELIRINGQWKIYSILRQIEDDKYKLPSKYDAFI